MQTGNEIPSLSMKKVEKSCSKNLQDTMAKHFTVELQNF